MAKVTKNKTRGSLTERWAKRIRIRMCRWMWMWMDVDGCGGGAAHSLTVQSEVK